MTDSTAARPTVARASLLVEYSDGSAFYLTLDEAEACHVEHEPINQPGGQPHDALDFRVPGGIAEPRFIEPEPDKVLSIDFTKCPGWRLVLRKAGGLWPDGERIPRG